MGVRDQPPSYARRTPCPEAPQLQHEIRERDRRPTLEELDKVLEHFFEMLARRPTVIHMPKVVAFAIFSTRRMDEIARIMWEDLDEYRQAVKVRDMKNPGQKIGNDVWCHLR